MPSIRPTLIAPQPEIPLTKNTPTTEAPRTALAPINIRNTPSGHPQTARSNVVARQIFPHLSPSNSADNEALVKQLLGAEPKDQAQQPARTFPTQASQPAPPSHPSTDEALPQVPRQVSDAQRERALRLGSQIFAGTLTKRGFDASSRRDPEPAIAIFRCVVNDGCTGIPRPGPSSAPAKVETGNENASRIPRPRR